MADNIINAVFGSGLCAVTTSAYRANYGMVLRFSGIDLPTAFECDFSNYDTSNNDSITAIGQNGEVQIPDDLWDSGLNIYAYVYLHPTDDSGVTVYTVTIPVLGRPNRTEEEPTPHEQSVIEQAISALNDAVEQTAADVETTTANAQAAAQSEANAATSERSAAASAGAALASQNAAESASQSATESASASTESARNAANSAAQAAESATNAQASAEQAERSVQSIGDDVERAEQAATTASSKANEASASATAAAQSASSAASSAQNADSSAQSAESSATDAEQAKTDAQDAQAAAEQAKDDAVSAADRAEQAEQEVLSAMDGTYENLTSGNAQQLLSTVTEANSVPYLFRPTAANADRAYLDEVVGGTVAWNQQFNSSINALRAAYGTLSASNDEIIYTVKTIRPNYFENQVTNIIVPSNPPLAIQSKHVIFLTCETYAPYSNGFYMSVRKNQVGQSGVGISNVQLTPNTWNKFSKVTKTIDLFTDVGFYWSMNTNYEFGDSVKLRNVMVFDLTQMFGSTIADYIYSLEQANAGAGVAYFRKLFPNDYYEYNSGELLSVEGVSAHAMRDADGNVISTYPLDSSLTLRGIPKLDASGNLYYDGDTYAPDGTVTRRYGVVDMGRLNYVFETSTAYIHFMVPPNGFPAKPKFKGGLICTKFIGTTKSYNTINNLEMCVDNSEDTPVFRVRDDSYTSAATFKAAMSGVYLVYELATPTTETASPYRHLQICDPNGTEEFVSTSIVPAGHNTRYPENLRAKIEGLPWNFNSIIAMTETTTTASKAYAVGDYFILNNVLYRVTSAIASGGTITIGTNCRATTIMDEIKALS